MARRSATIQARRSTTGRRRSPSVGRAATAPVAPPAHLADPALTRGDPVRVVVVGCGGTGSVVAGGLVMLHQAMRALGHPAGLAVTLVDGDRISAANCVRQPFHAGEVGLYKAVVLAHRANAFAGLAWDAVPEFLAPVVTDDQRSIFASRGGERRQPGARAARALRDADLVIGCVDSRAARALLHAHLTQRTSRAGYWLDFGNDAATGQVVLGQPANARNAVTAGRLPTVAELYPEIVDAATETTDAPSCSAAEALARQELFVNQSVAHYGLALLGRLFRYGRVAHHGGFVNLATGRTTALPVDPARWAACGPRPSRGRCRRTA